MEKSIDAVVPDSVPLVLYHLPLSEELLNRIDLLCSSNSDPYKALNLVENELRQAKRDYANDKTLCYALRQKSFAAHVATILKQINAFYEKVTLPTIEQDLRLIKTCIFDQLSVIMSRFIKERFVAQCNWDVHEDVMVPLAPITEKFTRILLAVDNKICLLTHAKPKTTYLPLESAKGFVIQQDGKASKEVSIEIQQDDSDAEKIQKIHALLNPTILTKQSRDHDDLVILDKYSMHTDNSDKVATSIKTTTHLRASIGLTGRSLEQDAVSISLWLLGYVLPTATFSKPIRLYNNDFLVNQDTDFLIWEVNEDLEVLEVKKDNAYPSQFEGFVAKTKQAIVKTKFSHNGALLFFCYPLGWILFDLPSKRKMIDQSVINSSVSESNSSISFSISTTASFPAVGTFSHDDTILAVADNQQNKLYFFDTKTGQLRYAYPLLNTSHNQIQLMKFSLNDSCIIFLRGQNDIKEAKLLNIHPAGVIREFETKTDGMDILIWRKPVFEELFLKQALSRSFKNQNPAEKKERNLNKECEEVLSKLCSQRQFYELDLGFWRASSAAKEHIGRVHIVHNGMENFAGAPERAHNNSASINKIVPADDEKENVALDESVRFGENDTDTFYCALAIDGEGMHALIPAIILKKLEQITKSPVYELFDCIVGSSFGGIVALGLVASLDGHQPLLTIEKIINLLRKHGDAIFANRSSRTPHYQLEPLQKMLGAYFKRAEFSHALTRVVVPYIEYNAKTAANGEPIVKVFDSDQALRNEQADFLMRDVACGTVAGSPHFPFFHLTDKAQTGRKMVAADPNLTNKAACLLHETLIEKALGQEKSALQDRLAVLSLTMPVKDQVQAAAQAAIHSKLREFLPSALQYTRLKPTFELEACDVVKPFVLDAYRENAEKVLEGNELILRKLLENKDRKHQKSV